MGSHQPAFQQSNDAMHTRQDVLVIGLFCLHMTLVDVTVQPQIGLEAIGSHRAAWLNRCGNKAMQGYSESMQSCGVRKLWG